MRNNFISFFYCLIIITFITGCGREINEIDYYDEKNYVKVEEFTFDDDKSSISKILFVMNNDTSRTMVKAYYRSGKLKAIAFYLSGKKDGLWEFYDEATGLKSYVGYYKNDQKDSTHKIFHENGRLQIIEHYKDGKEIGVWNYYDSSGQLLKHSSH